MITLLLQLLSRPLLLVMLPVLVQSLLWRTGESLQTISWNQWARSQENAAKQQDWGQEREHIPTISQNYCWKWGEK